MKAPTVLGPLVNKVKDVLAQHGYSQQGYTFFKDVDDVRLLVNLQRSTSSTHNDLKVTINLAVLAKEIAQQVRGTTGLTSVWDAHWRLRIGFLTPDHMDKWWVVRNAAEAEQVGDEIASIIKSQGLAALAAVSSLDKLRALWESGRSPGLTAGERSRYLELIP